MHRKGKTEASLESPEFFHMKFIPLVQSKYTESHKLLRPDLTYRCSPENPLIKPSERLSQGLSPIFYTFNKNTTSDDTNKKLTTRFTDSNKVIRPGVYYNSSLFTNYSNALKECRFNRHKSDFPEIREYKKVVRNKFNKDLDKERIRINKAKERKQLLIEYLKRIKNS